MHIKSLSPIIICTHLFTGYCSLDGLEKVTRPMCTLSKSKVVAGQDSETKLLNIIQSCPETPVLGGKSVSAIQILQFS